ncbi:MAG: hypothetical protein LBK83_04650 [Treponema sp.]|nr:hypothetical protein [Treponema sp.]
MENPGGENPGEDDPGEDDPGEDDPGEDDPGEDDPGDEPPPEVGVSYGTNNVVVSFPDANSATVSIAGYVPATSAFLMSDGTKSDLSGKNVSVLIENDGSDSSRPSDGTLSLTEVHKIYQALNAAAPASILIDSPLDPLYKGSDWIRTDFITSDVTTIYESYPSETMLMRDIKVRKEGGLYVVEYGRNLVVEDIVYDDRYLYAICGLGLYKKAGSPAVLSPKTGDWADVVIGGSEYVEGNGRVGSGRANESAAYLAHLDEAGLKYSGVSTPSPTHNMVILSTNLNLFSNGLYDFLKLHKDNNLMDRVDDLNLPFASTLDGQVYESLADRRLADGHHNPAFQGNVSVEMVNLIRGKIGATTEFSNINIIGDGKDLTTPFDLHLTNVSLVGDYRTGVLNGVEGYFYGNLDIDGDFPIGLTNNTSSPSGYLTAWEASGNTSMNNFAVFHVKPTDPTEVKRFGNSNSGYGGSLKDFQAIVFEDKASISNLGDSMLNFNFPHAYKVVRDPNGGSLKFTGGTGDGFATTEASNDTTQPVPSLDPDAWRVKGNSKTNPATTSWGDSVNNSKKWNLSDFNLISMVRDTGIRLADAVLSRLSGRSMGG